MRALEKNLIEDLMRNTIEKDEFLERFPVDLMNDPDYINRSLEDALRSRDSDALEDLLYVGFSFGLFRSSQVSVLCTLLAEPWHQNHEDIVSALQDLKDPSSVESLYSAALTPLDYLAYNDCSALVTKCAWALGDIGTEAARDRLRQLAEKDNQVVREAALDQLKRFS